MGEWLDPENPVHRCHDEMPTDLGRKDWQRRWQCSCGKVYKVQDSQRDGFYFAQETTDPGRKTAHGG
jgi:hypothetical protein